MQSETLTRLCTNDFGTWTWIAKMENFYQIFFLAQRRSFLVESYSLFLQILNQIFPCRKHNLGLNLKQVPKSIFSFCLMHNRLNIHMNTLEWRNILVSVGKISSFKSVNFFQANGTSQSFSPHVKRITYLMGVWGNTVRGCVNNKLCKPTFIFLWKYHL